MCQDAVRLQDSRFQPKLQVGRASDPPKAATVRAKTWLPSFFYFLLWFQDGPEEVYDIILEAGEISGALGHQCRAASLNSIHSVELQGTIASNTTKPFTNKRKRLSSVGFPYLL